VNDFNAPWNEPTGVRAAETITTSLGVEKDYRKDERGLKRVNKNADHDRAKRNAGGRGQASAEGDMSCTKHDLGFIRAVFPVTRAGFLGRLVLPEVVRSPQ
jgi:hypothetical protein